MHRLLVGWVSLAGFGLLVAGKVLLAMVSFLDAPWAEVDTLRAPDGREYAFLYYGVMQAQIIRLARGDSRGVLSTRYQVLGDTNGDYCTCSGNVRARKLSTSLDCGGRDREHCESHGRLVS